MTCPSCGYCSSCGRPYQGIQPYQQVQPNSQHQFYTTGQSWGLTQQPTQTAGTLQPIKKDTK